MSPAADAWTVDKPEQYLPLPYPGARPVGSWRLTTTGEMHRLVPAPAGSWRDLATDELLTTSGRTLVLAYGSNANPSKLCEQLQGTDVYALTACVEGWAAVWCSRRRASGHVVCTFAPVPSAREVHVALALTAPQLLRMDGWEGHPTYYRRQAFAGRITLENATAPQAELYLGTAERRPVLLRDGQPLRCAEVAYDEVDELVGWSTC